MAAVTVNSKYFNVAGSRRQNLYNVTGTSGDTLTVGLINVNQVNVQPAATTATVAAGTVQGTSIITLTGTISGAQVEVIGN